MFAGLSVTQCVAIHSLAMSIPRKIGASQGPLAYEDKAESGSAGLGMLEILDSAAACTLAKRCSLPMGLELGPY